MHKQVQWRVRTRTPARPHTPRTPKTSTPSCSGPGVRELRVPQHGAMQRQHNAFGAGIPPSLIQSWNDTHNDKVFADSIFEIINCVHCRILDGLRWHVLTYWEAHNYIINPMPRNTDSVSTATQPSTFASQATLMTHLIFSCVSIGASRVFVGGFRGVAHRSLQQPYQGERWRVHRPNTLCMDVGRNKTAADARRLKPPRSGGEGSSTYHIPKPWHGDVVSSFFIFSIFCPPPP